MTCLALLRLSVDIGIIKHSPDDKMSQIKSDFPFEGFLDMQYDIVFMNWGSPSALV